MRARNWLTSLAAPLVAAIAVGIAGVVVLGANHGGANDAPSALAAGFPPARSAAADFSGGNGRPVEVSAIAAAGPTEVAVGQRQSRRRAVGLGRRRIHLAPRRADAGRGRPGRPTGSWPGWRTARPAGSPSAAPRPAAGRGRT